MKIYKKYKLTNYHLILLFNARYEISINATCIGAIKEINHANR
jgi:hypothetical protein